MAAAFAASVFGSMVGLGGGFVFVPLLRLVFGLAPAEAAGTSLVLVLANSASATFAYYLQRRVALRAGLLLAAGGLPGSILGAMLVRHVSPVAFDHAFAGLLVVIAADMLFDPARRAPRSRMSSMTASMPPWKGLTAGFAVGLVSSMFGVGGGVIVVPTLFYFSQLPAHAISATSQFTILLTSPVGLATHALARDVRVDDIAALVLGGVAGGPLGARLSGRLSERTLLILIALAVTITALSLVLRHV